MAERDVRTLLDKLAFPEGPRWHDGRLFFSDQHDLRVVALDPKSGDAETVVEVPEQPSGLGWLADGSMLVVSMLDRKVMRLDGGALKLHADISALAPAACNDMVVDGRGRAYVGNFGFDMYGHAEYKPTNIVAVDADGSSWVAAEKIGFPNGTVVTPDNRTLIVGESVGGRLTAFDIGDNGRLSNRREWANLAPFGATADGICLDAENAVWVACPMSQRCLRVAEGGTLLDEIKVYSGTYACNLGGDDGRTLFICSSEGHEREQCVTARAGRILAVEVDVPGAGSP
jgi:sugar lactone lactonase YvrE